MSANPGWGRVRPWDFPRLMTRGPPDTALPDLPPTVPPAQSLLTSASRCTVLWPPSTTKTRGSAPDDEQAGARAVDYRCGGRLLDDVIQALRVVGDMRADHKRCICRLKALPRDPHRKIRERRYGGRPAGRRRPSGV